MRMLKDKTQKFIGLLLILPILEGCALIVEYPITSASMGVWGTTGKGPTDHAVSYALNEDCETLRAINSDPICQKTSTEPADVIDKSFNLQKPQNTTQPTIGAAPFPSKLTKAKSTNVKVSAKKTNKTRRRLK